ncbi:MAG: pirin family protein [Holophagaceae bacterium]|nr:pirin family protein [Holophagaceae bacterium]
MAFRTVASIVSGQPTQDGNGVPLRRLVPGRGQRGGDAFRAMDPFLLMDHFGPLHIPPGSDAGFPPHPHRGFQTLTYLIQGAFRHRDSTGGHGTLRPGGAQLMTAGSGIVHEEMPVPEQQESGGPIEGVQLWINLPKADKGMRPGYEDLQPEAMPWRAFEGGRIRGLAGTWLGVEGPARTPAAIAYAHLELEPGGAFEHLLPEGWTVAVVTLHGEVEIQGRPVPEGSVAVLGEGAGLRVSSGAGASFMVLAGRPLQEPIAHYGPFVMNTVEEIEQALLDYQEGRMGRLA